MGLLTVGALSGCDFGGFTTLSHYLTTWRPKRAKGVPSTPGRPKRAGTSQARSNVPSAKQRPKRDVGRPNRELGRPNNADALGVRHLPVPAPCKKTRTTPTHSTNTFD